MDNDNTADVSENVPCSLTEILEPTAALAAAQRMQRWYRSTPQGAAHSQFGRDGRRVEARMVLEQFEAEQEIETA
ncbi:MAG: hypothetical protein NTW53_17975 [Burkholderiales bacterium]|jgi:hypothetical protein|nr:hypothetical protein [Burkholderiales bacterium]